jgi:hypothetical protein
MQMDELLRRYVSDAHPLRITVNGVIIILHQEFEH